jgi:esterase/lipase
MARNLEITCAGYAIAADWYDGTITDRILLILPGYTSSKAQQADFTEALVAKTGLSALVIDYSGHGVSPFELKDTRPAQHFLEVIYAFDWLKNNYPAANIDVVGYSYGSFLGTQLTKYREFEKLVLRAPAIYKPAAFYDLWSIRISDEEAYRFAIEKYRQDADALARHPLLARASNFRGDTLVVVHEHDELVPRHTTDAYIKAFGADSFIAEGFTHSVGQSPISRQQLTQYQQHIANWLR